MLRTLPMLAINPPPFVQSGLISVGGAGLADVTLTIGYAMSGLRSIAAQKPRPQKEQHTNSTIG